MVCILGTHVLRIAWFRNSLEISKNSHLSMRWAWSSAEDLVFCVEWGLLVCYNFFFHVYLTSWMRIWCFHFLSALHNSIVRKVIAFCSPALPMFFLPLTIQFQFPVLSLLVSISKKCGLILMQADFWKLLSLLELLSVLLLSLFSFIIIRLIKIWHTLSATSQI